MTRQSACRDVESRVGAWKLGQFAGFGRGSDEGFSKTVWMPGGSMGHLAAAIEWTWIVLVSESSVPTTATFFPANSLDFSWSLNR